MKFFILTASLFVLFSCSKTNYKGKPPATNPGDTTKTTPPDTVNSMYQLSLKDTAIVFGPENDSIILHLASLDTLGNVAFTARIPQLDSGEFINVKITITDSKKNVEYDKYNVYREAKTFNTFINPGVYIVSVKVD
jgi:hypothetical protein